MGGDGLGKFGGLHEHIAQLGQALHVLAKLVHDIGVFGGAAQKEFIGLGDLFGRDHWLLAFAGVGFVVLAVFAAGAFWPMRMTLP